VNLRKFQHESIVGNAVRLSREEEHLHAVGQRSSSILRAEGIKCTFAAWINFKKRHSLSRTRSHDEFSRQRIQAGGEKVFYSRRDEEGGFKVVYYDPGDWERTLARVAGIDPL
jgi:hypothetical protein